MTVNGESWFKSGERLPVTSHTAPSTTSPVKILPMLDFVLSPNTINSRERSIWNKGFNGGIQTFLESDWRVASMLSLASISRIPLLEICY